MKGSNGDLGNKKYYSENKNTISKLNSRLDTTEKKSEQKHRSESYIPKIKHRKTKYKKYRQEGKNHSTDKEMV